MTCRERLEMYLHANHVPFAEQQHPTAYTARAVARSERLPPAMEAKVVVVVADGVETMLVLPASHRVDMERAAAVLRANRLRLAEESEFAGRFPDCAVGAEPPFGNLYGMPVYVDKALAEDDTIVFPVGTYTDTMSLKYADFERLVRPTVAAFAYRTSLE